MCTRRASRYAPTPHNQQVISAVRFIASTRLPLSQMIGAAINALPIKFSE